MKEGMLFGLSHTKYSGSPYGNLKNNPTSVDSHKSNYHKIVNTVLCIKDNYADNRLLYLLE